MGVVVYYWRRGVILFKKCANVIEMCSPNGVSLAHLSHCPAVHSKAERAPLGAYLASVHVASLVKKPSQLHYVKMANLD